MKRRNRNHLGRKVFIVLSLLTFVWGLAVLLSFSTLVGSHFSTATTGLIRQSEQDLVQELSLAIEEGIGLLRAATHDRGELPEPSGIPLDLYGDDEERIRKAIDERLEMRQRQLASNIEMLTDVMEADAQERIRVRVEGLEARQQAEAERLASDLSLHLGGVGGQLPVARLGPGHLASSRCGRALGPFDQGRGAARGGGFRATD